MIEFKFDTQLLIEGKNLSDEAIRNYITENIEGDCLLVVGDDEMITDEQAASGSHSLKVAPSGNLSWYKDTSYSYAKAFMQGYDAKKHLLLDCTWSDFYRDERLNNALNADLIVFRELIKAYKYGERSIDEIINILKQIRDKNADLPNSFALCIDEVLNLLARDFSADHVANSKQFSKSWGRGMQYIAFTAK